VLVVVVVVVVVVVMVLLQQTHMWYGQASCWVCLRVPAGTDANSPMNVSERSR
jgi:hypothetical protein